MGDSSLKNHRPFRILAFSLQLLSENKEHIEGNIQHLGNFVSLVWQETGSESPFWCFLASFTKEAHNQRITYEKSHFSKEFSANPHIFRRSLKKVSFIEESFFKKSFLYKGNILRLFFLYKGKCCIFAPRLT